MIAVGPDDLRPEGVVSPSESVENAAGLISHSRRGIHLVYGDQIFHRRTGDFGDLFRGVTRVVLLEELEHTTRILQRRVFLRDSLSIPLESPRGHVVFPGLFVVAGKESVIEIVIFSHDVRGIGVAFYVVLEELILLKDVIDHPSEERDIRARAQGRIVIGYGRRSVYRGSTEITLAPFSFAFVTHLMLMG